MRPAQFIASLLAVSTVSAAIQWPDVKLEAVEQLNNILFRRQDSSSGNSQSASNSASATNTDSAQTTATDSKSASNTNSASASPGSSGSSGTAKTTASGDKSSSKGSSTSSSASAYDTLGQAGGIQMVVPATTAAAQYYKIGDFVTFAWNYTSLQITPSAIDILASVGGSAQRTYTLAVNQSLTNGNGSTGAVTWDTGAYQSTATLPLLTETYTLIIYDAQSSISAAPVAGKLSSYMQYTFGMYVPQKYTPWTDFQCPTCNGAITLAEKQGFYVLVGTTVLTVLSFTWFARGFGLF